MSTTNQKIHLHGDLTLYPRTKVAGMGKAEKKKLHVLQSSGVTGNRHEILSKSVLFRWTHDGKEYVHGNKPFILQHVGGDEEHGKQEVEAGTYEIMREFEHDPHKNELRVVID